MEFNELCYQLKNSPIDVMSKRYSARDYCRYSEMDPNKEEKFLQFIAKINKGPFGSDVFIKNVTEPMGTFKVIKYDGDKKESPHFLVGGIMSNMDHKQKLGIIDFGYCFELAILAATGFGFGTCWIAGTFHSKEAEKYVSISKTHKTYCVTPYGVPKPASKITCLRKLMMRMMVGKRSRLAMNKIFFLNNFKTPFNFDKMPTELAKIQSKLVQKDAFRTIMESIRWAPSARNIQEWRIVYLEQSNSFCFFTNYISHVMVYIDIGIAMCHFEVAAKDLGVKGHWEIDGSVKKNKQLKMPFFGQYHFSYVLE